MLPQSDNGVTNTFIDKSLNEDYFNTWALSDFNVRERPFFDSKIARLYASIRLTDESKIEDALISMIPEAILDSNTYEIFTKVSTKFPVFINLLYLVLVARIRYKKQLSFDANDRNALSLIEKKNIFGFYWKNPDSYEGIVIGDCPEIQIITTNKSFSLKFNAKALALNTNLNLNNIQAFSFKYNDYLNIGAAGKALYLLNKNESLNQYCHLNKPSKISSGSEATDIVTIIMPVYRDATITKQAIDSIYAAKNKRRFSLIVINDASSDPKLISVLSKLVEKYRFKLIHRNFNSGFIGAVNYALELNQDDVILLNSDCVVFDNWLDRIYKVANSNPLIATVSVLSNTAELLSLPVAMKNNRMSIENAQFYDKSLSSIAYRPLEIPVGVGNCLYIKRACINEVGKLNDWQLIRGYGEETEFCLRASEFGWKHYLASNLFVYHAGNVSFGKEKQALAKINTSYIHQYYPEHSFEYDQFLQKQPLRILSHEVQKKWLPQTLSLNRNKIKVVFGSDLSSQYIESKTECNLPCILIDSKLNNGQQKFVLHALFIDGLDEIEFNFDELDLIINLLKKGEISEIEISSTSSLTNLQLYKLSKCFNYDFYLEDYRLYCPRRYLQQSNAQQCSDPLNIRECINCVDSHGALILSNQSLVKDRELATTLLKNANKIFATHQEIYRRHAKRWPSVDIELKQAELNSDHSRFYKRVIIPSIKNNNEGFDKFLSQITNSEDRHYFIYGSVSNEKILNQFENVHIIKNIHQYESLLDLAKRYKFDAVADYSDWVGAPRRWSILAKKLNVPLISLNQKDAMYV